MPGVVTSHFVERLRRLFDSAHRINGYGLNGAVDKPAASCGVPGRRRGEVCQLSVIRRDLHEGCFSITIERFPTAARAKLVGELDLFGTELLADMTEELLASNPPPRDVVLDLNGLVFADLVGVRGLVESCDLLAKSASWISVVRVPRKVERVLTLSGASFPEDVEILADPFDG
jgi:anti-anti-sigma factor